MNGTIELNITPKYLPMNFFPWIHFLLFCYRPITTRGRWKTSKLWVSWCQASSQSDTLPLIHGTSKKTKKRLINEMECKVKPKQPIWPNKDIILILNIENQWFIRNHEASQPHCHFCLLFCNLSWPRY